MHRVNMPTVPHVVVTWCEPTDSYTFMRFRVPMMVYMMITPFSNAMLCRRWRGVTVFYEAIVSIFTGFSKNEDSMFPWSGGTYLPNCMVSHPRIQCIQLYGYLGILLGWAPLRLPAIVIEIVIVFLRLYRQSIWECCNYCSWFPLSPCNPQDSVLPSAAYLERPSPMHVTP